jgi:integrase
MPLSDTGVRNAKPTEKARKIADEKGLYLLVLPSGSKLWRMDYRFQGKRKTLSFGGYPDTGLALARQKRDDARKLLAQDIDPSAEVKAKKDALEKSASNTFEAVATEWMKTKGTGWTDSYASKTKSALERHAFPSLGKKPITEISAPDLLDLLRAIEKRGTVDMAHRIQQHCGAIFRYAIATGKATADPVPSLRGALATVDQTHYAAITEPLEFGALLRDIDAYRGESVTKTAMQMMALTFQRTKEIRFAEWSQIDVPAALWRIPAEIMKMREAHVVPLSAQVLKIIEELRPLTGHGRLLFPSAVSKDRPISENTITYALARMGYKGRMTGHGFRSTASTMLNEQGYRHDVIERQLAHSERNQVRAAYNRAEYLPERRVMMQEWADYLDKLKAGAEVIPLRGSAA